MTLRSAGIRAFAQSCVREALAVPYCRSLSLWLGLEAMQIEDHIYGRAGR